MMGRTHATTGVAFALAATPALTALGVEATPYTIPLVVAASAGGAMMPDFDHHKATIAQSLPPLSGLLARAVAAVSGGHRNGTHSIPGMIVFTFLTAVLMWLGGVAAGLWCGFLFAVGLAALRLRFSKRSLIIHTIVSLLVGVGLVWLIASRTVPVPLTLVVWGFGIGYLAHIFGDMLTKEGCPLLWPFNKHRFRFANFTTGQFFETWVFSPLLGLVIVAEVVLLVCGPWQLLTPTGGIPNMPTIPVDPRIGDVGHELVRVWDWLFGN